MPEGPGHLAWQRVLDLQELPENRVKAVTCQRRTICYVWQTALSNPNFAEYARLCGALGIRVEQQENLDAALERALEHEGPSLVEVITDPDLL